MEWPKAGQEALKEEEDVEYRLQPNNGDEDDEFERWEMGRIKKSRRWEKRRGGKLSRRMERLCAKTMMSMMMKILIGRKI